MHIVLGGTSGLGYELAALLRADGGRVLVLGRNYDESHDGEGHIVDLYDAGAVNWAIEELDRRYKDEVLESFIWTAGYGWYGDFADQPDARSMVTVNFAGALPFMQWIWRRMASQEITGNVVVVSSTSGVTPRSDRSVYTATKHAQVGLARSLALEVTERMEPIRLLLCLPGSMKTPFWDGKQPADYDTFNDPKKVAAKIFETMKQQTVAYLELPLPRGSYVK